MVWLAGLPGDWLLDDYSLPATEFPSLLRPRWLSYLTFWLNLKLAGPTPWAFRLVNILVHAAAVQYCYRALKRLIGEDKALFAAAIFAVHPLQADAILYAYNRPVVLMGLLLWVALEAWLEGKHWRSVLFYGLALLAKEEAIAFPLVIAALHLSISRNRAEWKPIGVMAGLGACAVAGITLATRGIAGSGAGAQAGISPVDYLATQPLVIASYLKNLVWPEFAGVRWHFEVGPRWGLGLWLVAPVMVVLGRKAFARAQATFWAVAALLVLLPTSSVFPIADLAAARRMYLPVALLAAAFAPAARWGWALIVIYAALGGYWALEIYREPKLAWQKTIAAQPGRLEPVLQYAKYLPAMEAKALLDANAAPANAQYWTEMGRVHLELNEAPLALRAFGKALALEPAVASHVYNRGVALAALGQKEAAEADFRRALAIDPEHQPARQALATLRK